MRQICAILGCLPIYPPGFNAKTMDPQFSGKMKVLDYILAITKKNGNDRFVLVSNYTQTMDAFVEVHLFVFSFNNLSSFSCVVFDATILFDSMEACRLSSDRKSSNSLIIRRCDFFLIKK